ncbi:MAG: hypothetical protein FJ161_03520 [Gammaproteobacteria bacterium]|nr:hypothetical protein [Gammaproteobacteria bacterium]
MPGLECARLIYIWSMIELVLLLVRSNKRDSIARTLLLVMGACILTFVCLWIAGWSHDYSVYYVTKHGGHGADWRLNLGWLWAGQAGANLIIILGLSVGAYFGLKTYNSDLELNRHEMLYIVGNIVSFMLVSLYVASPFTRNLPFPPETRSALNPLLQAAELSYHPPLLLGATSFLFGIAVSDQNRSIQDLWIYRKFLLYIGLFFLTLGMIAGAFWAYHVLGWGGWWFWDPVETISFIAWLGGILLVHQRAPSWLDGRLLFLIIWIDIVLVRTNALQSVHTFLTDRESLSWIIFLSANIFLYLFSIYKKRGDIPASRESVIGLSMMFCITLYGLWSPIIAAWRLEPYHLSPYYFESNLSLILLCTLQKYEPVQLYRSIYRVSSLIGWILLSFSNALFLTSTLTGISLSRSKRYNRTTAIHSGIVIWIVLVMLQRIGSTQADFDIRKEIIFHGLRIEHVSHTVSEMTESYNMQYHDRTTDRHGIIEIQRTIDIETQQLITPIVYYHNLYGMDYGFCAGYDEYHIRLFYRPYMVWIWIYSVLLTFVLFWPTMPMVGKIRALL